MSLSAEMVAAIRNIVFIVTSSMLYCTLRAKFS
jgi:hypothetical protein